MTISDTSTYRFHLRAAAIIRFEGSVLLHKAPNDSFWALPGGRIENGEDSAAAVVRELAEELGVAAKVEGLSMIVENFFLLGSYNVHEVGFYFSVNLSRDTTVSPLTADSFSGTQDKGLIFRWVPETELPTYDIRPHFLQHTLLGKDEAIKHLVCQNGVVSNTPLDSGDERLSA